MEEMGGDDDGIPQRLLVTDRLKDMRGSLQTGNGLPNLSLFCFAIFCFHDCVVLLDAVLCEETLGSS